MPRGRSSKSLNSLEAIKLLELRIGKQAFDTLDDAELGAACFAPIVPLIRAKDIKVKQELYRQLSPGWDASGSRPFSLAQVEKNGSCEASHTRWMSR